MSWPGRPDYWTMKQQLSGNYQGRLTNIRAKWSLCLAVLSEKATDVVLKALVKCMKEKHIDERVDSTEYKEKSHSQVTRDSPLANIYPTPYMMFPPMPSMYGGLHMPSLTRPAVPINHFQYGFRGPTGGTIMFRPRGPCLFCESTDHQVKVCERMKQANKWMR